MTWRKHNAGSCATEDAGLEHKHTTGLLQPHLQQAGMLAKPTACALQAQPPANTIFVPVPVIASPIVTRSRLSCCWAILLEGLSLKCKCHHQGQAFAHLATWNGLSAIFLNRRSYRPFSKALRVLYPKALTVFPVNDYAGAHCSDRAPDGRR